MTKLTHIAQDGSAKMVDVGDKESTQRIARVSGKIFMNKATYDAVVGAQIKKGDVLGTARIAGIMAAKKTSDLIPLCHPLALTSVDVDFEPIEDSEIATYGFCVNSTARVTGKTGVEMEALTAASVACLTIYDMCKAMDRGMEISSIMLEEKRGGASGIFLKGEDNGTSSIS
ncbi:MAG: cyclic pyranopterin monophosphate synthase MoaC [Coriobacteriia bacterium]|nr:cyclic pyranopterin monophosphate synthase MoaC [Coriobacteriia bacterium]